jgi:hypothetical protein
VSKRFLKVKYNSTQARIDTKDMDDISQVQEKVLVALKEITVGYARVHRAVPVFQDLKHSAEE